MLRRAVTDADFLREPTHHPPPWCLSTDVPKFGPISESPVDLTKIETAEPPRWSLWLHGYPQHPGESTGGKNPIQIMSPMITFPIFSENAPSCLWKHSPGNPASFPVSAKGKSPPPNHLQAMTLIWWRKMDFIFGDTKQTMASILLFFQAVLICCPRGKACAHRAVFFAMRQEAEECLLPGDCRLRFTDAKGSQIWRR